MVPTTCSVLRSSATAALEVGIDAYYKISRGHNAAVLSEQPMNQSDA
jgi:hypothetical protein